MRFPLLAVLLAATSASALAAGAPADVIITGGTVYTGADVAPSVTDVVIVGDKIVYVGPNASARYNAERVIDVKGKIVAPGLIDGHAHPDTYIRSKDAKQR